MRKKSTFLYDVLCYVVIPYCIWTFGRESLGDYVAMLLSTVPGIIYTLYRFIVDRQVNIIGVFIIGGLAITTLVNILSGSAERMLWNQVIVGYCFATVFLLSVIIKKPVAMYFMLEISVAQGRDRKESKDLYLTKGLFIWFQIVTLLFFFRGVTVNTIKAWLIQTYGVDGYGMMIIYLQVTNWILAIVIGAGFIYANVKVIQHKKKLKRDNQTPITHGS